MQVYNDGNLKPVCNVVLAGFELRLLPNSRQEQTFTAHLTPMHFIEYTPCMYLQCTGQQWAGWQIKAFTSMYKSVHTGSAKREGNRNYPKWGFDQGCLN